MAYREIRLTGQMSAATMAGNISAVQPLAGTIEKAQSVIEKDYEQLDNKPKINGVELIKDKSIEELGGHALTNLEILAIMKNAGF